MQGNHGRVRCGKGRYCTSQFASCSQCTCWGMNERANTFTMTITNWNRNIRGVRRISIRWCRGNTEATLFSLRLQRQMFSWLLPLRSLGLQMLRKALELAWHSAWGQPAELLISLSGSLSSTRAVICFKKVTWTYPCGRRGYKYSWGFITSNFR